MDIPADVSVCVLPGEGGAGLVACIESLLQQNDPVLLELYVPKGYGLFERFAGCPEIHFLEYANIDIGSMVYGVWQQATGRYLAVYDSSVAAGSGSLFAMLDFLDEHPDVGAAAPRLFSADKEVLSNCFRFPLLPCIPPKKMAGWDGFSVIEIDWMAANVVFINRLAFAECSPRNFLGTMWSRSLCKRLRAKGWHQYFVPSSKAIVLPSLSSCLE